MPEFVRGFATYAANNPGVGEPLETEWTERLYELDGIGIYHVRRQDTTTGTLRFYEESNRIVFQPYPKDEAPGTGPVPAIDVSSYQPRDLSALIAQFQPEHVVVRLYLPEEDVPQDHSRAQIESTLANGRTVGGYGWAYRSFVPEKTVNDTLELAARCSVTLPILWLDCETYTVAGAVRDPGPDAPWLRRAAHEAGVLRTWLGLYSARWWWLTYMANTREFGELPLWTAQWDNLADLGAWRSYGGWKNLAGKQYTSKPVDGDVFLAEVCS